MYQSKEEVNEQIGRMMNQDDVDGKRKLFWKEVSKVNRGNMEKCSRIKNGNRVLELGENEVRNIWKDYF